MRDLPQCWVDKHGAMVLIQPGANHRKRILRECPKAHSVFNTEEQKLDLNALPTFASWTEKCCMWHITRSSLYSRCLDVEGSFPTSQLVSIQGSYSINQLAIEDHDSQTLQPMHRWKSSGLDIIVNSCSLAIALLNRLASLFGIQLSYRQIQAG